MVPQWIIEKKRDGHALNEEEIRFFIGGYTRGDIPDYQMAAMAMAIFLRGMNAAETALLTDAMMRSGDLIDASSIAAPRVDKHSTGGIGDKISLVLAPLLACCGAAVPMISGRGLGITGGTLDKLASIPGYRTDLSEEEFVRVVRTCGCSITGQTARLVPADRKLYALRDVTATVPSIPLITASIMSKKLAEGIDHLVLDVKFGTGAFMRTRMDAHRLASSLVRVGREMGRKVTALLTDMNEPLGRTAGNALEVVESVECLYGRGPADVMDLTLALGAELLVMAGLAPNGAAATDRLKAAVASGAAVAKFKEMVAAHGGDTEAVDDYNRLPCARIQQPLAAPCDGYLAAVDAEKTGRACVLLGAGRMRTEDAVDPAVGIAEMAKVGQRVEKGQTLAVIHASDEERLTQARKVLAGAFVFSDLPVEPTVRAVEKVV